jgi:hypothetical protein
VRKTRASHDTDVLPIKRSNKAMTPTKPGALEEKPIF